MEHFPQHSQDSEVGPLVRKNDVWSPLGYDTKIDVFKFLRPYDIRKSCVYVNKSWASFCVDNKRYLPCPRYRLQSIAMQRICSDENRAFEQGIIDDNKKRRKAERRERLKACCQFFWFRLALSAILLATWSCIVYLSVRINNQSKEDPTDDLMALCPFMMINLIMTYKLCINNSCYEDSRHRRKRRHWLIWLCFRLILCLAGLSFTYLFHLTPSTWALWIALTVIHIPECRKFFTWMNWTWMTYCLRPNFDDSRGQHRMCHLAQRMFTILVSIPHFATLLATFLTFHPDKAINIPSLIIFTYLISIVTLYKDHHVPFFGLCLGAISTLFPGLYPGRSRNENHENILDNYGDLRFRNEAGLMNVQTENTMPTF